MIEFKTPKPIRDSGPVRPALETVRTPTWVRGAFSTPISLGNVLSYETQAAGRVVLGILNFKNKLFIMHGNYTDNTGPHDIVYYDLETEQIVRPYTCQSEDIEEFKVIDGRLWIPGGDSKLGWSVGADLFVSRNGIDWETRRLPRIVHNWDICKYKGKLYVANGTESGNYNSDEVMSSENDGATWNAEIPAGTTARWYSDWVMILFELNGLLHAVGPVSGAAEGSPNLAYNLLWTSDGQYKEVTPFNRALLFPESTTAFFRVRKVGKFNGKLIALTNSSVGPHFLYEITSLTESRKVILPFERQTNVGKEELYWHVIYSDPVICDYLIRGDTIYVLALIQYESRWFCNIIAKSKDLVSWEEVCRFMTVNGTYGFSFEEVNGTFYVGYGSSVGYSGGFQTGNGYMGKVVP